MKLRVPPTRYIHFNQNRSYVLAGNYVYNALRAGEPTENRPT